MDNGVMRRLAESAEGIKEATTVAKSNKLYVQIGRELSAMGRALEKGRVNDKYPIYDKAAESKLAKQLQSDFEKLKKTFDELRNLEQKGPTE